MTVQQLTDQAGGATDLLLYTEVVRFYARQAHLLDSGQAERWAAARYGEFRVDAKGRALLVGLRGEKLEKL